MSETVPRNTILEADVLSLEALMLARTYLYTMFHKVFGGEPTDELLDILGSPESIDAVDEYLYESRTLAEFKDTLEGLPTKKRGPGFLWRLEAEYTRLLIGPGSLPAPPWESPYASNEPTLFQRNTLEVRGVYRGNGLRLKREGHAPDDHVSLMCCFMAHLSHVVLETIRERQYEAAAETLRTQAAFLRNHMNGWLPSFASNASSAKQAEFYPLMARALCVFAQEDASFAAEALAWLNDLPEGALPSSHAGESCFDVVEQRLAQLESVRLAGLEDNELQRIESE